MYTEKKHNRHSRHSLEKMSYSVKGRFFRLRNILNWIFVLLTIVGLITFFYGNQMIGGIILIGCVVIKLVECVLRIIQ